ncbi:glycosyltransferase [Paenibacillus sp. Soil522]|uniref:glycosyltransferase n=1 Tax=Paenibacillus sp. Soil522 TaxID=1736388 RepID=UPI000A7428BF|nr:glycosyltransferase [Paenibacillus sp. Soil522]
MLKQLSIVICTYNRAPLLERTLLALRELKRIEEAEVIVVDNNSSDDTAVVVRSCIERCRGQLDIQYVLERKQGLSAARNTGIKAACSGIIAFLDDDAIPVHGWIHAILEAFEQDPRTAAVGGIVYPNFETERPSWLIKPLELPYTIVNLGSEVRPYPKKLYPVGANMAFRSTVFERFSFPEELGRKGESLTSGEESWLFDRLKKQRMLITYLPSMTVHHFISRERLTKEWIAKRYYYQGLSYAFASRTTAAKLKLVLLTCMKAVYVFGELLLSRSEGSRLLVQCRRESIRGTFSNLKFINRS